MVVAKLNKHTLDERVTDFHELLSRGPIGQASQHELAFDAILQCIYDEPARSSIISLLVRARRPRDR